MAEEIIDPLLMQALKKWKSSFGKWWLVGWGIILGILGGAWWEINKNEWKFVLVSVLSVVMLIGARLPWLIKEMLPKQTKSQVIKKIIIWLLWGSGILAIKRVGWTAENIDNGTALFLIYLPAVWLFKIPRVGHGLLVLIIIPFLPLFLSVGMERTAEIWAVVMYFLLVVATMQMAKEIKGRQDD